MSAKYKEFPIHFAVNASLVNLGFVYTPPAVRCISLQLMMANDFYARHFRVQKSLISSGSWQKYAKWHWGRVCYK